VASKGRDRGQPPRVLIITGDGLNCERETAWAFTLAGAAPDCIHISDILAGRTRLERYHALAFIGGFSNGDHLGAGTVQAARFRHCLRTDLERFVEARKPIIGICNGFQTLVKMGILPGSPQERQPPARSGPSAAAAAGGGGRRRGVWNRTATIMHNDSGRFEDRWVNLVVDPDSPCIWTRGLTRLFVPVRHGEGKFYMRNERLLDELEQGRQVVARYATPEGEPTARYPENPNGSVRAIAAVCDPSGLIFGLMPHPESYSSPYNHPAWTRRTAMGRALPRRGEGLEIFRSCVRYLVEASEGRREPSGGGGPMDGDER